MLINTTLSTTDVTNTWRKEARGSKQKPEALFEGEIETVLNIVMFLLINHLCLNLGVLNYNIICWFLAHQQLHASSINWCLVWLMYTVHQPLNGAPK